MHKLLFLLPVLYISGCVTTTTGIGRPEGSREEAAQINLDLGISYLRKGDLEHARVKLEKSIRDQPDSPTAHRALGLVYEGMGEFDAAGEEYRLAVKQGPKDADALDQLAVFLCLHGSSEEALSLFDRAVAVPLNSRRYIIYTNAGTCAKRENDLESSEAYLRKALAANANYPPALVQIADVAFRRENYLQSRAFVERYLAASEPSPTVLWLAYQIEDELGARPAANELGQRLLKDFPESEEAALLLEHQRDAG
jgi:type IV pilus assembly protein PilF